MEKWTAENYLAHSAKGTSWRKKDHKYVKKEGNRYYYKDDLRSDASKIIENKAHLNEAFVDYTKNAKDEDYARQDKEVWQRNLDSGRYDNLSPEQQRQASETISKMSGGRSSTPYEEMKNRIEDHAIAAEKLSRSQKQIDSLRDQREELRKKYSSSTSSNTKSVNKSTSIKDTVVEFLAGVGYGIVNSLLKRAFG